MAMKAISHEDRGRSSRERQQLLASLLVQHGAEEEGDEVTQ
jgi:hypothetical protein